MWLADSKRTTILFKICKYIFPTYIQRKNSKDVRETRMTVNSGLPAAPKALLHLLEGHLQTPSGGSDNPRAGGRQGGSWGRQPPHGAPRCLGGRMAKERPSLNSLGCVMDRPAHGQDQGPPSSHPITVSPSPEAMLAGQRPSFPSDR